MSTLLYMQHVDCHVMWLSFNVKRATQHASLAVFYYLKSVWNL